MTLEKAIPVNTILQGDSLQRLKELPNDCIDCVITSPPYWNLRDYKTEGQLGLEPTFAQYLQKLLDIFDQIKRVIKPTGTVWVNLGDTYNGNKKGFTQFQGTPGKEYIGDKAAIYASELDKKQVKSITAKSLLAIPDRFKIAMIDRGWICRNDIIWWKRNCMPSSAKDRFTVDYERIFFFTKNEQYYFETQYEPYAMENNNGQMPPIGGVKKAGGDNPTYSGNTPEWDKVGRLKRAVWDVTTHGFPEAHFATFPEELVETPIKAGCPEYLCNKCDKAREIIYTEERINTRPGLDTGNGKSGTDDDPNEELHNSDLSKYRQEIIRTPKSLSDCGCNAGFSGGLVLDPFFGSGTTGLVALKLARNFIGIELNPEYIKMAMKRLEPFLNQTRLF